MPEVSKKPPNEVREVMEFLEAMERLEQFRMQHATVFAEYERLAADYNQKLEAADKEVRAQQVTCGPFDLYQFATSYDAKVLYDLIGRDQFLRVGGSEKRETTYQIDKTKVEIAIQQNVIPKDVVDVFKKVSPRYHKPEKIST